MREKIQEIVERYAIANHFSGVVRMKLGDYTLYEGAFGYACKPFKIPNRMDIRFANASITKTFTALAIFDLIDQGKLSLSDSVRQFLILEDIHLDPAITIEHLLTHTSGIKDYFDELDPDGFEKLWQQVPCQYVNRLDKMLPLFIDETPISRPGERFSYSGAGYILLGLIIESIVGSDYYTYMREAIFKKLYLFDTDFIPLHQVVDNVAEGYIPLKDERNHLIGWKKNIYSVPAHGLSDGGSFSTARDMIKFLRSIRKHELLSPQMTAKWLTPMVEVTEQWHYGYGLWFQKYSDGRVLKYGHIGENPGVSARVFYYPQQDIDLVLFSNHGFSTSALLGELEAVILNETGSKV
jgi:CubicO group peptidase (beta-lactamase class C family)